MKISIITPSYNQHQYLERTILSVINQNYSDIEYIIIDGGSTDGSIDIIKKYQNRLAYWESKKDDGQVHAINKGFEKASGEIVCWLNSDDFFVEHTLEKIAHVFIDPKVYWITGNCNFVSAKGNLLQKISADIPLNLHDWLNLFVRGKSYSFIQPSTFWRRKIFEKIDLLNTYLHYSFDHEFFYRIFRMFGPPVVLNDVLSCFRVHESSKTVQQKNMFFKENRIIGIKHIKDATYKQKAFLYSVYIGSILKSSFIR